jgi:hypothetical protein
MPALYKIYQKKEGEKRQKLINQSQNDDLRRQLNEIMQIKKTLSIKIEHWERIKQITKDPHEIREIERKIHCMRMEFLNFSTKKF